MPNINPAEAFRGGIKHPGIGVFYTAGLFGVAMVMAILPILYLGLICAVVYLTYWHAIHDFAWIMGTGARIVSPRVWVFKAFIYITPIFMGGVLAFFMVKPFFARRIGQHQPYALNPQAEPALYEFIWRVCAIVGAPMPSLIELDCNVNASAGLRHGLRSFFGRDLVLRIGLPLVAGLTVREFAGVLAHEFGHFTQGTAMRLEYIIRRIDGWFGRVIWERDAWDEWLEETSQNEDSWISVMAAFAQLGVWASRKILTGLLLIGHLFSCYLSRRMEFHADQFEIRLAGSAAFESVCERFATLQTLNEVGLQQMGVTWNLNKRLPDNLPQFILNMETTQMGAHVRKALKGQLGFVTTGLFHTHPSDAERVRAARLADEPGIVTIDAPASELFENFPVPARIVTTLFYEGIGLPLGLAKIYEIEAPQPKSTEQSTQASEESTPGSAIDRYFAGVVTPLRPIFPRVSAKIAEEQIAETISNIQALPAQINAVTEQVTEACTQFDYADQMMLAAVQDDSGAAEGVDLSGWREQRELARRSLKSVFEAYENRIESALGLAGTEMFAQVSRNSGEARQRIEMGLKHLERLQPLLRAADSLRFATGALLRTNAGPPALARLREDMADLEAALREVPCPAEFAKCSSLHEYYKALPAAQEPFLPPRAEALAHLPMAAYKQVLGELVLLAEQIVEQMNAPKPMRVSIIH